MSSDDITTLLSGWHYPVYKFISPVSHITLCFNTVYLVLVISDCPVNMLQGLSIFSLYFVGHAFSMSFLCPFLMSPVEVHNYIVFYYSCDKIKDTGMGG
jgi:hypothetical protein